jgi:glycerophosphoryl diester phosphodiesterase
MIWNYIRDRFGKNAEQLRIGFVLLIACCSLGAFAQSPVTNSAPRAVTPLIRAHAHNDYEHARPLLDALADGFCSVEADVWLVEGQLLVAHDRKDVKPERTLQSLYLEPLHERIRANDGRVFWDVPTVTLMIDVKSDAATTYAVLRGVLAKYRDALTEFTGTNTTTRALTVILSGNRPFKLVATEPVRHVALDGRLADLDTKVSPHLFPLISDNWQQKFRWRGQGLFPEDERIKLQQFVKRAHEQGCRLRFWGVPDEPAGWQELKSAGVDVIGTDDLSGLAKFLGDVIHVDPSQSR